jgi:hypothetical protein
MVKRKNPNGTKNDFDPVDLQPVIARRVLGDLLEQQPELKTAVAKLAEEAAKNPRMEDLAAEIEDALNRISAGDIYLKSGRTWRGYREPEEAAGEVLSEAVRPYFDRLEKLLSKKDDPGALVLCEAMILALYRVKHGDQFSEYEEYAEDFPEETADWAARLWRSAGNVQWAGVRRFHSDRTIPADFVQQSVPEWDWLLSED